MECACYFASLNGIAPKGCGLVVRSASCSEAEAKDDTVQFEWYTRLGNVPKKTAVT